MKARAPHTILAVTLSSLLLWCLLMPLLFFGTGGTSLIDDELVYCPLQKKWVAHAAAAAIKPRIDVFSQICAAPAIEANLFRNVFARLSAFQTVADNRVAEDLIFDYLRHGEAVVKAFRGAPLPSPAQTAELAAAEKALSNSHNQLFKLPLAAVFLQLRARPPTGEPSPAFSYTSFNFDTVDGNLSPNLLPRPPPVFS